MLAKVARAGASSALALFYRAPENPSSRTFLLRYTSCVRAALQAKPLFIAAAGKHLMCPSNLRPSRTMIARKDIP